MSSVQGMNDSFVSPTSVAQSIAIQPFGSNLTPTQRHMYTHTPGADFFTNFQTAFDQFQQETVASSSGSDSSISESSLANVLDVDQTDLAGLRGVGTSDQWEYASILDKAYSSGAMDDPQKFLKSLSPSDLDIVRRMHCLAQTISPNTLSNEGAENLLLPDGYSVDLNHDGIDEVGAAKTLHFPPRDAPASFTTAWFQATQNMGFGDYATHALTFLAALHPISADGSSVTGLPSDQLDSYKTVVDNYLSMLDNYRGILADGQYDRDKPFFTRLKNLLQSA